MSGILKIYLRSKLKLNEIMKTNEIKDIDISILPNHWQNDLKFAINKIINSLDFTNFSEVEKKWYIKEINEEQKVLFLLFNPINNEELELKKNFNSVVGWKNGFVFQQFQMWQKDDPHSFFTAENGLYCRILPFIEFQLLKFVNKHRKLKFGIEDSLKKNIKNESLSSLFTSQQKFQKLLLKLEENFF